MATDFYVHKKRDKKWRFDFTQDDGSALNVTGASITLRVRETIEDGTNLIQKRNLAAGGAVTQITGVSGAVGSVYVYLDPDDTSGLDVGTYEYDFKITIDSQDYAAPESEPGSFKIRRSSE